MVSVDRNAAGGQHTIDLSHLHIILYNSSFLGQYHQWQSYHYSWEWGKCSWYHTGEAGGGSAEAVCLSQRQAAWAEFGPLALPWPSSISQNGAWSGVGAWQGQRRPCVELPQGTVLQLGIIILPEPLWGQIVLKLWCFVEAFIVLEQ